MCYPDFLSFNILLGCMTLDMNPQLNLDARFGEYWVKSMYGSRLRILLASLFESDTYYVCSFEFLICL